MHKGRSPSFRDSEYNFKEAQKKRRKNILFEGREALGSFSRYLLNKDIYQSNSSLIRIVKVRIFEKNYAFSSPAQILFWAMQIVDGKPSLLPKSKVYLVFKEKMTQEPILELVRYINQEQVRSKFPSPMVSEEIIKLWNEWKALRTKGEV